MAIALGNVLDTIPGRLVIGAKCKGFETLSLSLMVGMFLGGVPEAAASAAMLSKAGYRPKAIFSLWLAVIFAGTLAAAAGKAFIGTSDAFLGIFLQALAGGAVLALVAHAGRGQIGSALRTLKTTLTLNLTSVSLTRKDVAGGGSGKIIRAFPRCSRPSGLWPLCLHWS
jgi:hypothetical protein